MAYQNVSFSAGETLTATKMNQMAANDAAFHDGTGIAAGAITADKIDFTTYSTTTEIMCGTWIDGKKIYRKTFQNTFSGSTNELSTEVPDLDLIIDWRNTVVPSANRQHIIGFRTGGGGDAAYTMMAVQYNKAENKLKFEFGSQYQGPKTVYTTIWYTKTS